MKKGQIEIIGLLIIVILLIVLIVVFIKFNSEDDDNYLDDLRQSTKTSSFLSSFLKIYTFKGNVDELIVKCGVGDCDDLDGEISIILDLIYKDQKYGFEFSKSGTVFHNIGACSKTIPSSNSIRKNNEIYKTVFWLC